MDRVLVTGSSGYKGRVLVQKLVDAGYEVVTFDIVDGQDIRDLAAVRTALEGCKYVVHLACLSNDPTADLDPALTRSINLDAFRPLVVAAREAGVQRFLNVSSSSVYGVKVAEDVTEEMRLDPLTDYSRYKAMCEEVLLEERTRGFETVSVRPATVCGMSPAMRFDLCVHILTMAAIRHGEIRVFGGDQYRPNVHIDDITALYVRLLTENAALVDGEVFNCGTENLTIMQTALRVRDLMAQDSRKPRITRLPSTDPRSYHVSSKKIQRMLGWRATKGVNDAITDLMNADIPDPDSDAYYRIRSIKAMGLKA